MSSSSSSAFSVSPNHTTMTETISLPSTAMNVFCYSSEQTKKAAYAQIKRDIATLKTSILSLKKYHNSLSNIARLPDELLVRIFTWNLSMQRKDMGAPWIRVAAVCTSWRRVALNCPHLWSFFRHIRVKWVTQVLLPRSSDAPLHIKATLFRRQTWEGLRKVLEEMHRIRELALTDRYVAPVRIDKLLSGLTDPAPILESFKVATGSRRNVHHLPDNLFNGFAPKLRKLKLESCIIPTSSPLISGLTTLALEDLASCLSLSQLLTLLQAALNVETLKLRSACKFDLNGSGEIVPPLPKVHVELSHLGCLLMTETIVGCSVILSCLCGPMTHLKIKAQDCDLEQVRAFGEQLAGRISSVSDLTISGVNKFEIYGQREVTNQLPMDLEFHIHLYHAYDSEVTKVFLGTLPLENLESLHTTCALPSDFWLEEFGNMVSLNTIRVERYSSGLIKALIAGLSTSELKAMLMPTGDPRERRAEDRLESHSDYEEENVEEDGSALGAESLEQNSPLENEELDQEPYSAMLAALPSVSSPLYFMALENLRIQSWTEYSESPGLDTTLLAAVLEARSIRGSTLQKLSVERCTHYSQNADRDVARMRQIVGSVTWYRVENGLLPTSTENTGRRGFTGRTFQTRRWSDAHSSDFHASSIPDDSDRDNVFFE